MTGRPTIYVDFSVRDPDARFYVARMKDFDQPPALGFDFVGTDFDEFEVACIVLALDYVAGVVYHRPVEASDVPGTSNSGVTNGVPERGDGVDASTVREPALSPT